MPDRRQHRGAHPDDHRQFGDATISALRTAITDLSWLLSHGYAMDSSLKLVGDRHDLTVRQRLAVRRGACSDEQVQCRVRNQIPTHAIADRALGIDGYNLLITVESALSGGAIFIGRDGCYRDLASVHGTYRKVSETGPALDLIFEWVATLRPSRVDWFLDRPVSNSGRLRKFMEDRIRESKKEGELPLIHIVLVGSPDVALRTYNGVVATSDSAILDRAACWTNLAAHIVDTKVPQAWKIDLRSEGSAGVAP
jgi:hypothetical protein